MKRKRCKHCGRSFILTSRHPNQKYCSQKECQRTRKNNWQRRKLAKDEDYRINQAECWAKWASQHPGYWKRYREKHSAYVQRNKETQRERNRINRGQPPVSPMISNVAKMDENTYVDVDVMGDVGNKSNLPSG